MTGVSELPEQLFGLRFVGGGGLCHRVEATEAVSYAEHLHVGSPTAGCFVEMNPFYARYALRDEAVSGVESAGAQPEIRSSVVEPVSVLMVHVAPLTGACQHAVRISQPAPAVSYRIPSEIHPVPSRVEVPTPVMGEGAIGIIEERGEAAH